MSKVLNKYTATAAEKAKVISHTFDGEDYHLDPLDEATMDGFCGCLEMVSQHIRELRAEYSERTPEADVLDRLYNRIAEDTK